VQSLSSETYAAEWISSLRNDMLNNCVFGTYRASATTTDCRSIISLHPATIRIDKNAHCTVRRSRLRVSSFLNFLELQCDLRQATLVLTMLKFRIALISRIGGWPKTRLYSRVNWLTLS